MLRLLVISTLVLIGCDNRSGSSSLVRRAYENGRAALQESCECFERLGFSSREECLASPAGALSDEQLDCLEREYGANVSAAEPTLSCQEDASAQLLTCLRAASDCDAMYSACTGEYLTALEACPELPESVQIRFQACASAGDRDEDGIPDGSDACPDAPEDFDGDADTDGCPDGAPADDTYSFCADTTDCADLDDQCVLLTVPAAGTSGTQCTHGCSSDLDCESSFGFPGACYDVEAAGFLCYQTCDFDSDCYSSSVCVEIALGGGTIDFICLPDN